MVFKKVTGVLVGVLLFAGAALAETSFEREILLLDKTQQTEVDRVFKEMLRAYEDEDARGFLEFVSEEKFRQNYQAFENALYEDFRHYEIMRIEYRIEKAVKSGFRVLLFVKWDKKYEDLNNASVLNTSGYSRFTFDEINGQYKLVELAGDELFGGSDAEWTAETPRIPGQAVVAVSSSGSDEGGPLQPDIIVQTLSAAYGSGSMTVTVTVKNRGTQDTPTAFKVSLTHSPSGTMQSVSVPALAAGATSAPVSSAFAGDYSAVGGFVTANADWDARVDESDEGNNTKVAGVTFF